MTAKWAFVMLGLLLAGCNTGPPSVPAADFDTVPNWEVGDSWAYETDGAYSQRFEVVGLEDLDGQPTYRVAIGVRDGTDLYSGTVWIRRADLGVVRSSIPVFRADVKTDCGAIFPLANRTITCHSQNQGQVQESEQEIRVSEEAPVDTPAGQLVARKVTWWDLESNQSMQEQWYAPEVAWLAQFDHQGDLARLTSTTFRR